MGCFGAFLPIRIGFKTSGQTLDSAPAALYLGRMCRRFTQHLSWAELRRLADLIGQPRNLSPRYNIAPTTQIEVIRAGDAGSELVPMRWGLVPSSRPS